MARIHKYMYIQSMYMNCVCVCACFIIYIYMHVMTSETISMIICKNMKILTTFWLWEQSGWNICLWIDCQGFCMMGQAGPALPPWFLVVISPKPTWSVTLLPWITLPQIVGTLETNHNAVEALAEVWNVFTQ